MVRDNFRMICGRKPSVLDGTTWTKDPRRPIRFRYLLSRVRLQSLKLLPVVVVVVLQRNRSQRSRQNRRPQHRAWWDNVFPSVTIGCWVVSKLASSMDELPSGLDAARSASASPSDRPGEILVEYNE